MVIHVQSRGPPHGYGLRGEAGWPAETGGRDIGSLASRGRSERMSRYHRQIGDHSFANLWDLALGVNMRALTDLYSGGGHGMHG